MRTFFEHLDYVRENADLERFVDVCLEHELNPIDLLYFWNEGTTVEAEILNHLDEGLRSLAGGLLGGALGGIGGLFRGVGQGAKSWYNAGKKSEIMSALKTLQPYLPKDQITQITRNIETAFATAGQTPQQRQQAVAAASGTPAPGTAEYMAAVQGNDPAAAPGAAAAPGRKASWKDLNSLLNQAQTQNPAELRKLVQALKGWDSNSMATVATTVPQSNAWVRSRSSPLWLPRR